MRIKLKEIVALPKPFGECLIKFNKKDQRIIWELYCELLPLIGVNEIKEEEDLLIDVIDSWDNFSRFAIQKIKDLGPRNFGPSIQKKGEIQIFLSSIILELINQHIQPFLKKWKDKFHHYWNISVTQNPEINSIKRQLAFPEYNPLFKDILELQRIIKEYSEIFYIICQITSKEKYIYAAVIIAIAATVIFLILFYTVILPSPLGGSDISDIAS